MINNDAFVVLAGDPSAWDEEMVRRCRPGRYPGTFKSEDVCKVQVEQHVKGRRSATLCETIYGWSVRLASGLDDRQLLFVRGTKEAALAFGIAWANEDPKKREFYVRKDHAPVSPKGPEATT